MSRLNSGDEMQIAALTVLIAVAVFLYVVRYATATASDARRPNTRRTYPKRNWNDVGRQLQAVMNASFEVRPVMNVGEYRVFKFIEQDVLAMRRGYRVFAQTSLGAVLDSNDKSAFRAINSKRTDVLVIDAYGRPILAIEYQGDGHYQGDAAARDAIKKEALRKAGVGYLEVLQTDDLVQIRLRVKELLSFHATPVAEPAPIRRAIA